MHRRLSEAIFRIEEDQEKAVEVPPEAPGWARAVEAVAKLDARNEGANILSDIHKSMVKAHGEAMDDYRKASAERHSLFTSHDARLAPHPGDTWTCQHERGKRARSFLSPSTVTWRNTMRSSGARIGPSRFCRPSSVVYFFVSALVLAVATAGAAINYSLISRPMAEMVGGTSFIGSFRTADIAGPGHHHGGRSPWGSSSWSRCASRGSSGDRCAVGQNARADVIHHLHNPVVDGEYRAGLAYMREVQLQDELATSSLLRGDAVAAAINTPLVDYDGRADGYGIHPALLRWCLSRSRSKPSFIRCALSWVSWRSVCCACSPLLLRVLGNGARHLGTLTQQLYDIMLFVPLWIETRMAVAAAEEAAEEAADAHVALKRRRGRRRNHEASSIDPVRLVGAVRLRAFLAATSHRRLPVGRYLRGRTTTRSVRQEQIIPVRAVALAAGRLDRGRTDRHG